MRLKTTGWALDLGTTNSGVALWDESQGKPRLIELPAVCRKIEATDPLEAPRLVPSSIHFLEHPGPLDLLGSWPPLARFFIGRRALIGRPALERNEGVVHPSFVPTFKPGLSHEPLRPLARLGRESLTARDAAYGFLRELLREVKRTMGQRVGDLVVTSPVTAFEMYRAEVQHALRRLGVRRVRFVDEPVAAALGYGISLSRERTVLVVDVGGGTMHVVLVRLSPKEALTGQATVLAKRGRPLGGNAVDGWVLRDLCGPMDEDPSDDDEVTRLWRRLMLSEACRVKEAVFFEEKAAFLMSPAGLNSHGAPRRRGSDFVTLTRDRLRQILDEQGFYRSLGASVEEVLEQGRVPVSEVEDVMLVGGSTLLPGFFSWFEERFERRRVRAWQPFEAVVFGAACFAGERMDALDFIVHDYAFVTHDAKTGEAQHTVIVPRGTRFPTSPELWKRQLVPTCALGEPESLFKLLICEVSRTAEGDERRFIWDAAGDLHKVGGTSGNGEVVVPLNAASPTLGYLDPPHSPRDRRPRLEIAFGVNSERWLIATVRDLLTQRDLMREEPVVRLV